MSKAPDNSAAAPESQPGSAFLEQVRQGISRHGMLPPRGPVLVAVSGGADSVALLHALHALGYAVSVAHFDHQTRAGASAADAAHVARLAEALGVPMHQAGAPVAEEARALGKSFETHARDRRYAFLLETARELGGAPLATGHHRGDQAETLLLRLLRGTSPQALGGIRPVRVQNGIRIIRPLLDCTRAELLAWLRERGIAWREDHSNADPHFQRNRVRHELLPLLEEHSPQMKAHLARLAETTQVENDFWEKELARAGDCIAGAEIQRAPFAALHPAVQRRLVAAFLWQHGAETSWERVLGAAAFIQQARTGQRFDLGGAGLLHAAREAVHLVAPAPECREAEEIALPVPGTAAAFGRIFRARLREAMRPEAAAAHCTPRRQVFDARRAGTVLRLRTRRPGDRFAPLGMQGTRKLQDYFVDLGLPAPARTRHPLVTREDGEILWVVGHAVSRAAALGPDTTEVYEVEVEDATD